jgi:hypothetical protein
MGGQYRDEPKRWGKYKIAGIKNPVEKDADGTSDGTTESEDMCIVRKIGGGTDTDDDAEHKQLRQHRMPTGTTSITEPQRTMLFFIALPS